jgi:START domain
MKGLNWLFFVMIFEAPLSGQSNWTLEKEKDGIKISSRHAQASQFNDIRVELDLPGNIEQLAAILLDVNQYKEWSYATKKSVLVRQLAPEKLIYYTEIEVPWPATNRCFYANFELKKDLTGHSIQVVAVNFPGYGPVSKDLLEVPFTKGVWNIKMISPWAIHVDYILELNPGGSLPAWVLNLFSNKGPMETFENLRKKMSALNPG